jgi:hypothetical protein
MRFDVLLRGQVIWSADFSAFLRGATNIPIHNESASYEFRLAGWDHLRTYQIEIGGVPIEEEFRARFDGEDPRELGLEYRWRPYHWFDSCVGLVPLHIRSSDGSGSHVREEAGLTAEVTPSKIQWDRYRHMVEDLRTVSAGVIFDFEDFHRNRNTGLAWRGQGGRERLPNIERLQLRALWSSAERALLEIEQTPKLRLKRTRRLTWCIGTDRLDSRALSIGGAFANVEQEANDGILAPIQRLEDSPDTPEHRMMRGMLLRFEKKLTRLKALVDSERRLWAVPLHTPLAKSSSDREQVSDDGRRKRLDAAGADLEGIHRSVQRSLGLSVLRGIPISHETIQTPIFREVPAYRRFRRCMAESLQVPDLCLEAGPLESLRRTDKLYEIWVFIQLASALGSCGLIPVDLTGLRTNPEPNRYIFAIERNTSLLYQHSNGLFIRMRYQPWISPQKQAVARGDSIHRRGTERVSFEPDVVIEFFRRRTGGIPVVPYVVVLDAKYSHVPEVYREKVDKYFKIGPTMGASRPIAGQVWIVHVRDDEIVADSDCWGRPAPASSDPRNEQIDGYLGLRPPEKTVEANGPTKTAVDFAAELLRFIADHPILAE